MARKSAVSCRWAMMIKRVEDDERTDEHRDGGEDQEGVENPMLSAMPCFDSGGDLGTGERLGGFTTTTTRYQFVLRETRVADEKDRVASGLGDVALGVGWREEHC